MKDSNDNDMAKMPHATKESPVFLHRRMSTPSHPNSSWRFTNQGCGPGW